MSDDFEDVSIEPPYVEPEPLPPNYLAQIVDGKVAQVIVGNDVAWAVANLGGEWVDCEFMLVGTGWLYNGVGFTQPASEE